MKGIKTFDGKYLYTKISRNTIGTNVGLIETLVFNLETENITISSSFEGKNGKNLKIIKEKGHDLTELEKAYIAGILDGEGWISIQTHNYKRSRLGYIISKRVVLCNTDEKLVQWLKEKLPDFNLLKEKAHKKQHKPLYTFTLTDYKKIVMFLEEMLPFLIIKKEKAELMITFCKSREKRLYEKYSEEDVETMKKMKELNKRGVS